MTTKGMSWGWKDQDGSGNIDEREFNDGLREYTKSAEVLNQETGFVVPRAGRSHYFYTPIYDPYGGSRAEQHYSKMEQDWAAEDAVESGNAARALPGLQSPTQFKDLSKRSSRSGTYRSPGRSPGPSPSRSAMDAKAGRTPWVTRGGKLLDDDGDGAGAGTIDSAIRQRTNTKFRERHKDKPRFKTHAQLTAHRAEQMLPDISFDVDGDGVVSAQDFFLANKFDVNGDKMLDGDEVVELRKQMVKGVVEAYEKVPKAPTAQTRELLKDFTENLDKTVKSKHFLRKFERLYNTCAVSMTWDSKYTGGCLQPFEQKGAASGQARSLVGSKAGKTFRSVQERARDSASLEVTVDTSRSTDTMLLARDPGWMKGGERNKWSGFTTREGMLKARKHATRELMEKRLGKRMNEHIIDRNKEGADLPLPSSWGEIITKEVAPRYAVLDTDRDGIIQREEFYSNNSKVGLGGLGIKNGELMDEESFQHPPMIYNQ